MPSSVAQQKSSSLRIAAKQNGRLQTLAGFTRKTGLIENLDDSTLLINLEANLFNQFGIAGTFNRSGNDGAITVLRRNPVGHALSVSKNSFLPGK